ncbi:MAG: glutamine synthetase [Actinobacteria bacterium]|jgi:glutamine synthetase|nr:glutamine synthetase [Actinomycetota bacterium]NDA94730.1 glutamine synthetase [Actinomycetota bacterium]NDH80858.1 glutamine synthetase [Actinomycetota bacterium]NDH99041.1 glutamine synthetase [Actinomycetota bacterium]NDI07906.1 glutamine synthetase [Actinomycetota bacterium]
MSSLSIEELTAAIQSGAIDTVVVAMTDMQGRLTGKRIHGEHFLNEVLKHGTEGCNYLLAVDVDMNTVQGYEMSSWERGYSDFELAPDFNTLRLIPWQEGAALVLADVQWLDHSPVVASPRQILRKQIANLEKAGMQAMCGTELEFVVYKDSYEEAWNKAYRDLTPVNQYNVDYSILGGSRIEPLLREIRLGMAGAGMTVESVKGECNLGQHEIAFKYSDALSNCDQHVIYKNGAKEIAAEAGYALTFMAKPNEREGNSSHIHLSFRGLNGELVMTDEADKEHGMSDLGRQFIAGQLAHMRELSILFAPNINSYKRYVPGSFAPTAIRWGRDNRTCAFRLVGRGAGLRLENRIPGGDVNPYLAVAGIIAAGLDGITKKMKLEPAFTGNAYVSDSPRVPSTMNEALDLWEKSAWVKETFGDEVQAHYANMARVEIAAYGKAVTDWELFRNFERF